MTGNRETGKPGNRETGKPGNRETGKPGNRETGIIIDDAPDKNKTARKNDVIRTGIASGGHEVVQRYGSANAEYIKGYRGVDNETGQAFNKSLRGIAKGKIHPDYAKQNIKQQAGYSAEVAATSRDNAEAIINKSSVRTARSEDVAGYGKNHPVVDRVQLLDGHVIDGSQSQMKFVGDRDDLFAKIANEKGKLARYRGVKLELPSEQYEGAAQYCRDKAQALRQQAEGAAKAGNPDVAAQRLREADNYEQLANNVQDSGLTTEEAIFHREHPKLATARDIARTSHRAGLQAAQYGAAIGGVIATVQNVFAVARRQKELGAAVKDIAVDTAKAGALGYATGATGSALKSVMQQSGSTATRALSKTGLPALVVSTCVSLSGTIRSYVRGDISEAQMLADVGEKGAGMLSAGMMAAVGQVVIPVPFAGAIIGGMVGHTLSSMFYHVALESARRVEASREQLQRIRDIETAARARIAWHQEVLDHFIRTEIPQLREATHSFFNALEHAPDVDAMAAESNRFAALLGKQLEFANQEEFDSFMDSDRSLQL